MQFAFQKVRNLIFHPFQVLFAVMEYDHIVHIAYVIVQAQLVLAKLIQLV